MQGLCKTNFAQPLFRLQRIRRTRFSKCMYLLL